MKEWRNGMGGLREGTGTEWDFTKKGKSHECLHTVDLALACSIFFIVYQMWVDEDTTHR